MSALTSLLVRDDAVSVRQIEEALARQLVDGGELDTALLELSALPENKLIAYRAASERGQPATREQVMSASSATRALLPGELAIALQVSPLSHEDKSLTVAAVRMLKPAELAQLAERTGMQIHVRVTSELRLLAALERFYGHALLPRYAVLLNRVDAQPAGELVSVEPMQAAVSRASMKTEQMPAFDEAEDFQAVLAAAFERVSMSPHAGTPAVDPDETRPLSAKRAFETQRRRSRAPEETARLGSGMVQARPAQSTVRASVPSSETEQDSLEMPSVAQPAARSGDDPAPSSVGQSGSAKRVPPASPSTGQTNVAQLAARSIDRSGSRVAQPAGQSIGQGGSASDAQPGAASFGRSGSSVVAPAEQNIGQGGPVSTGQSASQRDVPSGLASFGQLSSSIVSRPGSSSIGQSASPSEAGAGSSGLAHSSSSIQHGEQSLGQGASVQEARSGLSRPEPSGLGFGQSDSSDLGQPSSLSFGEGGSGLAHTGSSSFGEGGSGLAHTGSSSVGEGDSLRFGHSGSSSFGEGGASGLAHTGSSSVEEGDSLGSARTGSSSVGEGDSSGLVYSGSSSMGEGDSSSLVHSGAPSFGEGDWLRFGPPASSSFGEGGSSGLAQSGSSSFGEGDLSSVARSAGSGFDDAGSSSFEQRGSPGAGSSSIGRGGSPSRAQHGSPIDAGAARSKDAVGPARSARPEVPKLSMADTQGALSTVEDRDAVLDIYFRYARQLFHATALFTLKDGRAIGVHAHNIKSASDIRDVSSPVVRGSAIEELTRTLLPRVMDLGRKDEDRALVSGIKRLEFQPAALVPICIKRRVVAVLYGDRGGEPLHLDELTDLLTLMPHVTLAFERIIRARKALGLTGTPSNIGELSHAPTQRSMPAVQSFGSEARSADLPPHAKHVHEALKIPQALPRGRSFGLPDDDGDIYATARIPIQPLPLDQFESPPRYLSKPPPGTGRYQSLAPKGAEEVLRPPSTPSELREERTASSRRPPPRSDAGPFADAQRESARNSFPPASSARRSSDPPVAGRRTSVAPPAPNARRSVAPPATTASSHPSLAAPKPAPGSGIYHSQVGTTELINMPPGRKDELVTAGVPASQELSSAAQGYLRRPDSRAPIAHPQPANHNHDSRGGARVSSLPPKSASEERNNPVAQLIDALCRSEPNEDPPAIKALVAMGEPALTALLARFPGPLWFDRRKPHARLPLGRDISPICRALDAFGDQATERLAPLLGSNMTEVRYYATLFAGDRVRPSLLDPLLTRLFDDDPQIRLLVRDALPHYRKYRGFERVIERICEKARAESAPLYERLAAIDAICMLRDASCVSTLIDLIGHRDKQICVPAHRALTLITCQDFGKTTRKWRSWLNANADRHRVEWLIEGLMHSEESLRATAGLELQKLTQVYYGYVAAASKREREAAQKRYAEWWRTEGRTRIAT